MFLFEGSPSEKCKNYMGNRNRRTISIVACITSFIFIIPTILLAILNNWIFIVFFFALLTFPIISVTPLGKPNSALIIPLEIVIDTQDDIPYIAARGEKFESIRELSQIKSIIDMGDWYVFIFFFPHKCEHFVCEKALLRQGTIREFEDYFAAEIISKKTK